MASEQDSTRDTTSQTEKVARAMTGVGRVRSSDDPVPDLWSEEPAGERRDATCSAVRKRNEELVTAPWGYQRHESSGVAIPRRPCGLWPRCKELGKPDAGKPPVRFDEGREADGHWPSGLSPRCFPPTLHPDTPRLSVCTPKRNICHLFYSIT